MSANDDYDERPNMIAAMAVSISLAYIAVTLRLVARWKARAALRADDYLILVGLATTTGFIIASAFMVRFGLGLNVDHVMKANELEPFVKSVISAQCLYSFSIIPVKLSILALYHRLFPSRKLKNISVVTAGLIASYAITQCFCFVLQCIPMSSLWTRIPGRCIDLNAMLTTMSVMNVSTDFLLVALPIPFLWNLKIDNKRKAPLIGMFLLGAIVCVFGILRSVFVGTADSTNPSRSYVQGAMWSILEICVGIVSACLPTLRPLFKARAVKNPTGSNSGAFASHNPGARAHEYPLQMVTRSKAAKDDDDDDRPFVKLDEEAESGVESRPASSLGMVGESRGHSRSQSIAAGKRDKKNRRDDDGQRDGATSRNGIMVTTDIRIHGDGTQQTGR